MRRSNLLIGLATLALTMACLPTVAGPAVAPSAVPSAVNTFIVQTADAASTQTAAAQPTASPTQTFTSTPRFTETASPTPTRTFIFILPGATLLSPTLQGLTSGTSNSAYGCRVFNIEPPNGTVLLARTDFIAKWSVKNIGKNDWFRATMDYVYSSGERLHKVASYSIPKGAEPGKNVVLPVDMEAPKDRGTFTTTWALVVDNHYFCPLTLTIVVQ